jgi:Flp pilus assembly protein TadD
MLLAMASVLLLSLLSLGIPSVRTQMGSFFRTDTLLALLDNETINETLPDPTAPPQASNAKKPGLFKKIVTSPVRLVAKIFRSGEKKQSLEMSRTTEKDAENFRAVPVTRTRDGLGNEVSPEPSAVSSVAMVPSATSAPAITMAAAAERTAAALMDEAAELQQSGRTDSAIEKLRASLTLRPNYSETYNLLGVCLDEKGQYRAAQEEYERAVKLDQYNPRYLNNLGYSCFLAGDHKGAIKWYKKALKITPDDRRLHNNIGLAYGRRGEYSNAREHFLRSVGEVGAQLNLGYVYSQQGRYEEAIKEYESALRTQPDSLTAVSNLAYLYERAGRLRDAMVLNEQYKRLVSTQGTQTSEKR